MTLTFTQGHNCVSNETGLYYSCNISDNIKVMAFKLGHDSWLMHGIMLILMTLTWQLCDMTLTLKTSIWLDQLVTFAVSFDLVSFRKVGCYTYIYIYYIYVQLHFCLVSLRPVRFSLFPRVIDKHTNALSSELTPPPHPPPPSKHIHIFH